MRLFLMFMSGMLSSMFGYCVGTVLGGRRMARETTRLTRGNTDLANALRDCMSRYNKLADELRRKK